MIDRGFEVVIARDIEDLSRQAAGFVIGLLKNLAEAKEHVAIALSGGTTPKRLYELLSTVSFHNEIPWNQVHLFWGDERFVPLDHPYSNYRIAYDTLISKIQIPQENVHPMPCEKADPQVAAYEYEERLRRFFGSPSKGWPQFDLVLLGVGVDGHTASLFPGSSLLKEKRRWVAAPYVKRLNAYRLTLTLPVLNNADQIIFLVAGKEKAQIMKGLFAADNTRAGLPVHLIRPSHGKLLFFLDESAACLIDQGKGDDQMRCSLGDL